MLTQLRIKNFKAWRDTQEIRLAPITVFFGNNSSGKSSIHQLLLMLKQTARSSDRSQVLDPGDGRGLVELGTFRDMIHNHVSGDHLGFEIGWDLPKPLRIVDSKTMKQSTPIKHLRFSCEVGENGGPSGQMSLYRLAYSTAGDNEPGMSFSLSRSAKEAGKFELTASGYDLVGQVGRKWAMGRPVHFYGFPGEAVARYQNSACLPDLALEFERLMDSVHYIGPLREHPKRTYVVSGAAPEQVEEKGEYWLPALLSGLGRKFNRQPKAHYIPFEDLIESWGDKLGLMRSFRPRPLSENGKDYQVDIRTAEGRPEVRLPDVGFGVSQILPVLVECFYVKPHSTIILEQPEIHLHPSVQASLADLFVETIKRRLLAFTNNNVDGTSSPEVTRLFCRVP